MDSEERVKAVEDFKAQLKLYQMTPIPSVREWLNQHMPTVRHIAIESKTFSNIIVAAPPILGQPPVSVDPFEMISEKVYGRSLVPQLIDILDKTIGVLKNPLPEISTPMAADIKTPVQTDYAFIAMPMESDYPELVDVLDTIKSAAKECHIVAERIDEDNKNERITARMLENVRRAEFIIVDLTYERPSVYYEAGYAERSGNPPIFVARKGTHIHFDVKDFPIIFFENMKQLREGVAARLRSVLSGKAGIKA